MHVPGPLVPIQNNIITVKSEQKEKERYYLEKILPQIIDGKYSIKEFERPDFLIEHQGTITGIEVTEIHNPKGDRDSYSPSEKHGALSKFVSQAKNEFIKRNPTPLNVNIGFARNVNLKNSKRNCVCRAVVERIIESISNISGNEYERIIINTDIPPEIRNIQVYYRPNISDSIWYTAEGTFLPNETAEHVQEIINKKNRKVVSYLKNCDRICLLLLEGLPPVSWFDSFEEVYASEFTSEFDAIFTYRIIKNEIEELRKK